MALSCLSLTRLFASLASLPRNELQVQPSGGVGGGVSEMLI